MTAAHRNRTRTVAHLQQSVPCIVVEAGVRVHTRTAVPPEQPPEQTLGPPLRHCLSGVLPAHDPDLPLDQSGPRRRPCIVRGDVIARFRGYCDGEQVDLAALITEITVADNMIWVQRAASSVSTLLDASRMHG